MPQRPEFSEVSARLRQALETARLDRNYEKSARNVDLVVKDEDIRTLRFQMLLLEDENEQLNDQLLEHEERTENVQQQLEDSLLRSEELGAQVERLSNELRQKCRDIETMKAEIQLLHGATTDSAKVLTEKLALARELSTMKPELEHLRTQAASHQILLAEKLALEREVTTLQVELENEKKATQRISAKVSKAEATDKAQIEQLREELRQSKLEHKDSVREAERLQKELEEQRQISQATSKSTTVDASELDDMKKDLQKEKREREKAERALHKSQAEWEAQKGVLDDKLNAFRTKLKSTKEKLKEAESSLEKARAAEEAVPKAAAATKITKRKLTHTECNPDATIGTPGDGFRAKRGKRTTLPGDKSTFSITPFLSRTTNVMPDSSSPPASPSDNMRTEQAEEMHVEEVGDADPETSSEGVKKPPRKSTKPKPLGPAASAKTNTKPAASRKKPRLSKLESVAEEGSENEARPKLDEVPSLKPTAARVQKTRKSLASFATFTEDSAMDKRKKRKLPGTGLGKTLFDDDDDGIPSKPIPGKGMFAKRSLAKGGLFGVKGGLKGGMVMSEDGFQFSPLKKDRKAAAAK